LRSWWNAHPIHFLATHSFVPAPPCLLCEPDVSLTLTLIGDGCDAVHHWFFAESDLPRRGHARSAAGRHRRRALPAEDALRVWVLRVGVCRLLIRRHAPLVCAGVACGGRQWRRRGDEGTTSGDWGVVRGRCDRGGDAEGKLWLCGACDFGREHVDFYGLNV
jgi:hypothetical protein